MKRIDWKIHFFLLWIPIYISGLFIFVRSSYSRYFQFVTQGYFLAFFIVNSYHVISRYKTYKLSNEMSKFFNECIVSVLTLFLSILYPSLLRFEQDLSVRYLYFFHIWDSLSIHLACWVVYIYFARRNNKKKGRVLSYQEWCFQFEILQSNTNHNIHNFKRKIMHFLVPIGMLTTHYAIKLYFFQFLPTNISIDSITYYSWLVVFLHLIWVMNLADLLRLHAFSFLGRFATRWFENSLKNEELTGFTSAPILVLAWTPLFLGSLPLIFMIVSISTVSDAIASIIGKKYPLKRFKKTQKSIGGFLAGWIISYLIIILTNIIFPFTFWAPINIYLFAFLLSCSFLLIDIFSNKISDNFLNSAILGTIGFLLIRV